MKPGHSPQNKKMNVRTESIAPIIKKKENMSYSHYSQCDIKQTKRRENGKEKGIWE